MKTADAISFIGDGSSIHSRKVFIDQQQSSSSSSNIHPSAAVIIDQQ